MNGWGLGSGRIGLGGAIVLLAAGAAAQAQDSAGGKTSVMVSQQGREVYEQICQACHMPDARGGSGAGAVIPALAGNPKLADKDYPLGLLLHGRGGMPSFTDLLSPEQMAAVVNYLRGHFNSYTDTVSAADVARIAAVPRPAGA